MNGDCKLRRVKVLFDETHSESWSTSREKAAEISPDYPEYSSYHSGATLLKQQGFLVERNLHHALTRDRLEGVDILVLPHPCDSRWERTISPASPQLSPAELKDIQDFVLRGGSLLVITEYEHDKYGDNLNELLHPFGLAIQNGTVLDRTHCENHNPTWLFAQSSGSTLSRQLTAGATEVCFYQAGYCTTTGLGEIVLQTSPHAHPPLAGLIGVSQPGEGRVILVTDSLLFGDDYLSAHNHQTLWLNCFHWLAVPRFRRNNLPKPPSEAAASTAWQTLRESTDALRLLQEPDGSIPLAHRETAHRLVNQMIDTLPSLARWFPHQAEYLHQLPADLTRWIADGCGKPDFQSSLALFHPERHRVDQVEHLVLFPLYSKPGSRH